LKNEFYFFFTLFVYCLLSLFLLVLFGHRVDDRNELDSLQTATANKEAIDIGFLGQVVAVLRFDRPCKRGWEEAYVSMSEGKLITRSTSINNSGGGRYGGRNILGQPLPDLRMDFLCLLRRSCLTSANGPDRLVR